MTRQVTKAKKPYKLHAAPVEELVLACYFPHVMEFRAEHVGLFWAKQKSQFPKSQQVSPLFDFGEVQTGSEVFPMPRFWFTSADDTRLIQIQRNAFLLNWRRRPNQDYPHFDAMLEQFTALFELFRAFITNECGQEIERIERLEINYINIIPPNELWKTSIDIAAVFPKLSIPQIPAIKNVTVGASMAFRYQLSPADVLSVTITNGKRPPNSEDVFILDVKVQGTPSDKLLQSMSDWFANAHETTRTAFLAFTNPEMRKEIWNEEGDV